MNRERIKPLFIMVFIILVVIVVVSILVYKNTEESRDEFESNVVDFVETTENDNELPEEPIQEDVEEAPQEEVTIDTTLVDESTQLPYVATQDIADEIDAHGDYAKEADEWLLSIESTADFNILLQLKDYMIAVENEYAELTLTYVDDIDYYLGVYLKYAVAFAEDETQGSVTGRILQEVSMKSLYNNSIQDILIKDEAGNDVYEIYVLRSTGKILVFRKDKGLEVTE